MRKCRIREYRIVSYHDLVRAPCKLKHTIWSIATMYDLGATHDVPYGNYSDTRFSNH